MRARDDLEEQPVALASAESGTVEAVVGTQPDSSAESGTPVTVQPDDAEVAHGSSQTRGGSDIVREDIQPEAKQEDGAGKHQRGNIAFAQAGQTFTDDIYTGTGGKTGDWVPD